MCDFETFDGLSRATDAIGKTMAGRTRAEARAAGCCVGCGRPLGRFRDWESKKEYGLSGLCQRCQDQAFAEE